MNEMLLGISPDYLYLRGGIIQPLKEIHRPYFLTFPDDQHDVESVRSKTVKRWEDNKESTSPLSFVSDIGKIEEYQSFWDFDKTWKVFKVFTKESFRVPEVSNHFFFNLGLSTAEHDIPYHQRALVDITGSGKTWLFDSKGKKETLKLLVYDIEMADFQPGKTDLPIDVIGHADAEIVFSSSKDLETERFRFDIHKTSESIDASDVHQLVAENVEEEIDNLVEFCKLASRYDIISGHNIAGFDNRQVYGRIQSLLKQKKMMLSGDEKKVFQHFLSKQTRLDKSFHFGMGSDVIQMYPCTFDTYLAARKFYPYLDSHSLKAVAPFLDVGVEDRLILKPSEIGTDEKTLRYNAHDVIEQMGVTLHLIQQALPLSFTTGMPFETLLSSGTVSMWDHMALIRGSVQKKIIPATCRVNSICKDLLNHFPGCDTRENIISTAKQKRDQLSKEFVRMLKYGAEMPEWMLYPYVIYNENAESVDERMNYHMPGGMTIKPDKDANSHFIPWYKVVVADVGAMYPTILKALNIGADTVRLCPGDEKPDMWVWFKRLPASFFDKVDLKWRKITDQEGFADKGYMIGIKINKKPGVVNCAMTGIMSMIQQIKNELQEVKNTGDAEELKRLKMMYQSVKGARNAGTHGILAAPNVSGRQFNLWGAGAITTKGQVILDETLKDLQKKDIRVTYGDTDGIYMGCSRSLIKLPDFADALGIESTRDTVDWLTSPDDAVAAIKKCNERWQQELNYQEFELEPEYHDAMVFVKHKNYLIFDEKNGIIQMNTKGNNFKGSDKANIARKALKEIMLAVLKDNPTWVDEQEARLSVRESIRKHTQRIVASLDFSKVDLEDLTLIQSVKPAGQYKKNQDGSLSTFGKRADALEKLMKKRIRSRTKYRFVVTKNPLPDIINPSKSGVKPIDYMYPVDLLEDKAQIDLEWYKEMVENYIQGAFGLPKIGETEQTGLDAWM